MKFEQNRSFGEPKYIYFLWHFHLEKESKLDHVRKNDPFIEQMEEALNKNILTKFGFLAHSWKNRIAFAIFINNY